MPSLAPVRAAPLSRRTLVLGSSAILLIVVWLGVLAYLHVRADRDLRDAVAETQRLDPNWTFDEIEAKRITLPDGLNSATRVREVKKLLPKQWPPEPSIDGTARPGAPPVPVPPAIDGRVTGLAPELALDHELACELRRELVVVQAALERARTLRDLPQGRYAVEWSPDWLGTVLPCQEARAVAILLRLDAAQRAHDGDIDGALASAYALLNAARSIGDEPTALSQLARVSITSTAILTLERTLAQGVSSEPALAAFHQAIDDEMKEPLLLYLARGERAGHYRFFRGLMDGSVHASQMGDRTQPSDGQEDAEMAKLARFATPKMLRLMNAFVEAAKLPPEQQVARLKTINPQLDKNAPEDVLLGLFLPAFDRIAQSNLRFQAHLRCASVALAAERFRQATGRWPGEIAEMVPTFLTAVPLDPFDGQPLRWKPVPMGLVIYSVGPDEADDGGRLDPNRGTRPGTDFGIRLWDAAARRQVPEQLTAMPREEQSSE